MLYTAIRVILALAAAAVAFVMLTYSREDVTSRRRRFVRNDSDVWVWSGGVFLAVTVVLCLLPVENLLMGFATPQSSFRYNHTGEIMEIDEYNNCALVVVQTGDNRLTTHVLPQKKDGRWKLETVYNRKREVATLRYCMAERLYVPGTHDCFVIVTHSAEGNISDVAANVIDNRNTNFEIVNYPDTIPFYYGFVTDMDEDYTLYVDGEKMSFV